MSSSYTSRLADRVRDRPFDRDVAVIALCLGVALLPLRFVLSHLFAETLPVVLVVASLLYLLAYRGTTRHGEGGLGHQAPTLPTPIARLSPAVAFLGVAAMIVVATLAGARTPAFYALAALSGSAVLLQVFFAADEDLVPGLVVLQLLVIGGAVRFAALFTTAGFVGIDIYTHISKLAVDLQETGSLAAMRDHASRGAKYYTTPLYHLLVVGTSLLAAVPLETALTLSLGVGMVLTLPLAYATAARTLPVRWALAATALYAFSDHAIKWSIHLIPTSLGVLFYLAGFYYFVRVLQGRDVRDVLLLVGFIVALTLSHQVSAFIMLVTIGTAAVVQYVVTSDLLYPGISARNLTGLFVFQTGLLTLVWSVTPYRGSSFTAVMLAKLRRTLLESAGLFNLQSTAGATKGSVPQRTPSFVDQVIPYVDVAGFMLVLGLTVLGCLYAFRSNRTSLPRLLLVFVVSIMVAFALFLPIMGVGLFLPGRWFAFMYLPMAALGALGLGYLARNLHPTGVAVVLFVLAMTYPAAMLVSTDATLDAPVFDQDQPRFGYNEAELEALERVGAMVDDDRPIYTDSPYTEVFRRTETAPRATILAVNPNTSATPDELVVYREYHSAGAPYFDVGEGSAIYQVDRHDVCGPERSRLYANGEVSMCYGDDPDAVTENASAGEGGGQDGGNASALEAGGEPGDDGDAVVAAGTAVRGATERLVSRSRASGYSAVVLAARSVQSRSPEQTGPTRPP